MTTTTAATRALDGALAVEAAGQGHRHPHHHQDPDPDERVAAGAVRRLRDICHDLRHWGDTPTDDAAQKLRCILTRDDRGPVAMVTLSLLLVIVFCALLFVLCRAPRSSRGSTDDGDQATLLLASRHMRYPGLLI